MHLRDDMRSRVKPIGFAIPLGFVSPWLEQTRGLKKREKQGNAAIRVAKSLIKWEILMTILHNIGNSCLWKGPPMCTLWCKHLV